MKKEEKSKKAIRPLIKWTGGKYDEFNEFSRFIPSFVNYYEPFFGGGGVFFKLQPNRKSFINDKSTDLVQFYGLLNEADFKVELDLFVVAWDEIGKLFNDSRHNLLKLFDLNLTNKLSESALKIEISKILDQSDRNTYPVLFEENFCISPDIFLDRIKYSLADKFRRIKRISENGPKVFSNEEKLDHIETGFKSGMFLYFRSLMNASATGSIVLTSTKHTAIWYYVREFCYASMFRFNAKGEFNIPYGGIAYNRKNFGAKVNGLFQPSISDLFARTTVDNLDFADFLKKRIPTKNDFIFLDPPYDSEFSEYDNNSFSRNDQIRLRDSLHKVKAKWMMVIKETDFIRDIYAEIGAHMRYFDKKYAYNVRGRNSRDTRHIIISNYQLEDIKVD